MEIWIDGERRLHGLDGTCQIALCRAQDPEVGRDDSIRRLEATGLGKGAFGSSEIAPPPPAGSEPEIGVGRWQAARDRPFELRLRARAVARLQTRVAEPQVGLAIARIVAQDPLERRDERRARELARRHLRDARRELAAIFGIGSRAAGVARRSRAVPERAQPFGRLRISGW